MLSILCGIQLEVIKMSILLPNIKSDIETVLDTILKMIECGTLNVLY